MKSIFDIGLDCDLPLPELADIDHAAYVVTVRKAGIAADWIDSLSWAHHWRDKDEQICISMAVIDEEYILRFPDLVDFSIAPARGSIEYYADTLIPVETIRHLLLDQVIPRLLGQQGRLVLHASAVALEGEHRVIAFIGDSGWGKSTLASSFLTRGATLLTDDCLLLERCSDKMICIPNYDGVRLFSDSAQHIFDDSLKRTRVAHYSEKKRLMIQCSHSTSRPERMELAGVVLLNDPNQSPEPARITMQAIQGAGDLIQMISQLFVIDASPPAIYSGFFRKLGEVLSLGVPIYRLDYLHDYTLLPEVQECVLDAILNNGCAKQ